ncbi:MAG: HPr family phosphocarrier protein [Candidatus Schekmanbacteria bacterium]|nr:HPr family phosphocarrier protein [Candidatus Schekmanbacteria bacterium]
MLSRTVRICNKLGLHARAASSFVKTASKYKAKVNIARDEQEANGKSILGVMTLAAAEGCLVTLSAEGEDAQPALDDLAQLIENRFGEAE